MLAYYSTLPYGIIECRGLDAADFLQRMTTNDMSTISIGSAAGSVLVTEKGRIVDLITVARPTDSIWLLITSPRNDNAVLQWLRKYIIMEDVQLSLTTQDYATIEIWHNKDGDTSGNLEALIATISHEYGGAGYPRVHSCFCSGYALQVLLISPDHLQHVIEHLRTNGAHCLDDQQRSCIRIQSGIAQFPDELNERYTPLDAGLSQFVTFGKGCFIGQEVLERLVVQKKVKWSLSIIECGDRAVETLQRDRRLFAEGITDHAGDVTSLARTCDVFTHDFAQPYCGLAYISRAVTLDTPVYTAAGEQVYLRSICPTIV